MTAPSVRTALLAMLPCFLGLAGCERIMQNMYDQPRDKAYSRNEFFDNKASSREPLKGTVPYSQGASADTSSGRAGHSKAKTLDRLEAASDMPLELTQELLHRGKERYSIYCLPCHSPAGDGDGRIVRRGFPAPPSFHTERLRSIPDRHIFDVISDGYGVMHAYGDRVQPDDRWAIVAFIRVLQTSQYARLDSLPAELRERALRSLAGMPDNRSAQVPDSTPANGGSP